MCGLFGSIGNRVDVERVVFLGLLSQARGTDAAGFWTPNFGVVKEPGTFDKFAQKMEPFWKHLRYEKVFLGHTRAASHGSPDDNNNNHPLSGKKFVLMHNGVVWTKEIKGYPYKGETDSEVILSYLETQGVKGLKKIQGSASLVWVNPKIPHVVYMWRHRSPLVIGGDGRAFYYASETEFLKRIFKGRKHWIKSLKEHVLAKIILGDKKVKILGIRTIKPKYGGFARFPSVLEYYRTREYEKGGQYYGQQENFDFDSYVRNYGRSGTRAGSYNDSVDDS